MIQVIVLVGLLRCSVSKDLTRSLTHEPRLTATFSLFSLVDESICSKNNFGRILTNKDSNIECQDAAAQLRHDIDGKDDVLPFLNIYDNKKPKGCYIDIKDGVSKLILNLDYTNPDSSSQSVREECSKNKICICRTCPAGTFRDQAMGHDDKCTTCPAGYRNPHNNSVKCDECTSSNGFYRYVVMVTFYDFFSL